MLLVTGAAGFIGFHLAKKRLEMGDEVVCCEKILECMLKDNIKKNHSFIIDLKAVV